MLSVARRAWYLVRGVNRVNVSSPYSFGGANGAEVVPVLAYHR